MSLNEKSQKNSADGLLRLVELAAELRLGEYWALQERRAGELRGADLGELYLLNAQLKLLATDPSVAEDLTLAKALLPNGPQRPLFWDSYVFTAPNSLILFSKQPGSLDAFLNALEKSRGLATELLGDVGFFMTRQIEGEILYYMGAFPRALKIADELRDRLKKESRYDRKMLTEHLRLRCNLALGNARAAQKSIQQMITLTQTECFSLEHIIYQTARAWVNLTTGWAGDTPRFYVSPTNRQFPIYEDRTEAIQWGIAELKETEVPIVDFANLLQPEIYTLRQLYADLFDALLAFKHDDYEKASVLFLPIYLATKENHLVMPFAEYGEQITPFLKYLIEKEPERYDESWMGELVAAAESYEMMLGKYRDELR